jgi:RHH-type transcriptional regulator, proline utilization regulon repressor / proline dehydrogenase / delta 1-pyrroline-5-carboxylate dehydrogenase
MFTAPPATARLPFPYRPESEVLASLLGTLSGAVDWPAAVGNPPPPV